MRALELGDRGDRGERFSILESGGVVAHEGSPSLSMGDEDSNILNGHIVLKQSQVMGLSFSWDPSDLYWLT